MRTTSKSAAAVIGVMTLLVGAIPRHSVGQTRSPIAHDLHADVVVYGATPAGVAAATAAASSGVSVILLEPTDVIGGSVSNGLNHTDFISFESLGGAWREFMRRVVAHYQRRYGAGSAQVAQARHGAFSEPSVAQSVFKTMLKDEPRVRVLTSHRLEAVSLRRNGQGRLRPSVGLFAGAPSTPKLAVAGKVFIDATYEGDLLALSGVPHTIGREARETYSESGAPPVGDVLAQCMNFRITLTRDPANRLPIPRPVAYNPAPYEALLPLIASGRVDELDDIVRLRLLPNQKADFNDRKNAPVSLRRCGQSALWATGPEAVRERIARDVREHNQGLLYFLHTDDRLPQWLRREIGPWGLAKDEFVASGHWPRLPYVREGRRMLGEYVFTQRDGVPDTFGVRAPAFATAVAIGDYNFNAHGVSLASDGSVVGSIDVPTRPFQIPYAVMLPTQVDGLLVPVAVSASHVGYGAIRMEPTWTALGEAAGLAAAMAVRDRLAPRAINVDRLQDRLHARGALTFYTSDVTPADPSFRAVQYFGNRGLFQDLVSRPDEGARTAMRDLFPGEAQWKTAFPFHAIEIAKPVSQALADQWSSRVGIRATEVTAGTTRGQFLMQLYERVRQAQRGGRHGG